MSVSRTPSSPQAYFFQKAGPLALHSVARLLNNPFLLPAPKRQSRNSQEHPERLFRAFDTWTAGRWEAVALLRMRMTTPPTRPFTIRDIIAVFLTGQHIDILASGLVEQYPMHVTFYWTDHTIIAAVLACIEEYIVGLPCYQDEYYQFFF